MNIKNIHVNMLDRACTVGKIDRNQCQELKSESGYHASHEISGGLGTRAQRVVFFSSILAGFGSVFEENSHMDEEHASKEKNCPW